MGRPTMNEHQSISSINSRSARDNTDRPRLPSIVNLRWQKSRCGAPSRVAKSSFRRIDAGAYRRGNSVRKAIPARSTSPRTCSASQGVNSISLPQYTALPYSHAARMGRIPFQLLSNNMTASMSSRRISSRNPSNLVAPNSRATLSANELTEQ